MTGLDVEKWDARFDSREDATVVLEVGVKWIAQRSCVPRMVGYFDRDSVIELVAYKQMFCACMQDSGVLLLLIRRVMTQDQLEWSGRWVD